MCYFSKRIFTNLKSYSNLFLWYLYNVVRTIFLRDNYTEEQIEHYAHYEIWTFIPVETINTDIAFFVLHRIVMVHENTYVIEI